MSPRRVLRPSRFQAPSCRRTSAPVRPSTARRCTRCRASTGSPQPAWDALIEEAAHRFGIPPSWVRGVMRIESGGRTMLDGRPITSPAGAMGLMQVMPTTFAAMTGATGWAATLTSRAPTSWPAPRSCARCTTATDPRIFLPPTMPGPGASTITCGRPTASRRDAALRRGARAAARRRRGPSASESAFPVQDLTSADAMRARPCPLPGHRPTRSDPRAAPLFVAAKTGDDQCRQPDEQPNDALFVRLTRQDQRAGERVDDRPRTDRCADE